jgi:hypothetical protein
VGTRPPEQTMAQHDHLAHRRLSGPLYLLME